MPHRAGGSLNRLSVAHALDAPPHHPLHRRRCLSGEAGGVSRRRAARVQGRRSEGLGRQQQSDRSPARDLFVGGPPDAKPGATFAGGPLIERGVNGSGEHQFENWTET